MTRHVQISDREATAIGNALVPLMHQLVNELSFDITVIDEDTPLTVKLTLPDVTAIRNTVLSAGTAGYSLGRATPSGRAPRRGKGRR